jgi:hypothetical protein
LPAFWANGSSWESATVVNFASRQIRTMNAQLVPAATISGRVTNIDGAGIQEVQVMTYSTSTESWLGASAFTDAQGYYTLKGVQAGGVKLKFAADQAPGIYASEWSNDKATYSLADTITLAAGKTRSSVNAVLAPDVWTSIQGDIPTAGAGATVEVFDGSQTLVKTVTADSAGHFIVTNVQPGSYRLKFTSAVRCFLPSWYVAIGHGTSFAEGSDVIVSDRNATTLGNSSFEFDLVTCA